jgi:queuosine precursor transporter
MISEKPEALQARDLRTYRHFDLLLAIFLVVLLISNLVGQKLCGIGPFVIGGRKIGPFVISGGQLLFPLTYIFGDVFTEVYGYAASRRAIWLGFLANGLLAIMGLITVWLPPAPGWHNQEAFATVFYQIPRLIVASLIAYWCGEFTNSYTLAKMKLWTGGKALWTRTVGSTITGQFVDTIILVIIGFGGTAPPSTLAILAASAYVGKVVYEVVATPLTYLVVGFLKRSEGLDAFDYKSKFNPFHFGTH